VDAGEIIQPLGERVLGRSALEDVVDPFDGNVLVKANGMIDEGIVNAIENSGIAAVKIRTNLTCESKQGLCVKCYGRNMATLDWVEIGEPIGVVAAQSIGEPGTQLTMRTFHIGGTASRVVEQTTLEAKKMGRAKYSGLRTIKNQRGENIVMNRNGAIVVEDEGGREIERYAVVYAANLKVNDGQEVQSGQTLVEWDPYTDSILTEVAGTVAFGDVVEGVTMKEDFDEITGLSTKVIIVTGTRKNNHEFLLRIRRAKLFDAIFCQQVRILLFPRATVCMRVIWWLRFPGRVLRQRILQVVYLASQNFLKLVSLVSRRQFRKFLARLSLVALLRECGRCLL